MAEVTESESCHRLVVLNASEGDLDGIEESLANLNSPDGPDHRWERHGNEFRKLDTGPGYVQQTSEQFPEAAFLLEEFNLHATFIFRGVYYSGHLLESCRMTARCDEVGYDPPQGSEWEDFLAATEEAFATLRKTPYFKRRSKRL